MSLKEFFISAWELPQTLLAWILIFQNKGIKTRIKFNNAYIIVTNKDYNHKGSKAVSLGRYILASESYTDSYYESIIKHEYGHCRQSLRLGWLYLIVVGFFSYGNNFFWRSMWYGKKDYYDLFPERWADILGETDNRRRYKW